MVVVRRFGCFDFMKCLKTVTFLVLRERSYLSQFTSVLQSKHAALGLLMRNHKMLVEIQLLLNIIYYLILYVLS